MVRQDHKTALRAPVDWAGPVAPRNSLAAQRPVGPVKQARDLGAADQDRSVTPSNLHLQERQWQKESQQTISSKTYPRLSR